SSPPRLRLRRRLGLEHLQALAQRAGERAELADLVAEPAYIVGERRAFFEIADHFLAAAAQPAVELAIDHAAHGADRRGVADHAERFERCGLAAIVLVGAEQLDPLARVARLAMA